MQTVKALYQCRRIAAIGGGHGLGRVMASLGFLGERLAGIVATTDDGGSTGRLREASGCIAWGDLRNCLNQLCSDNPNLSRVLFEYRFRSSGELSGHNLGNLILLALDQMVVRPLDAVNLIRQMLQVDAQLIPMSEEPAGLSATLAGREILGETTIDSLKERPEKLRIVPDISPTREALGVLSEAEMIILGPGSFMTSILPALLMPELANTIKNSAGLKVFVGNIQSEISPVGQIGIIEKLEWMEQLTGIYPDVLLWPAEREKPGPLKCDIQITPLADNHQSGAHSQEALRQALEILAGQYFTVTNQSKVVDCDLAQ